MMQLLIMPIKGNIFQKYHQSGALQDSEKNKFLLRGGLNSATDGILLVLIMCRTVVVTAGRVLIEGTFAEINCSNFDASLQSNTPCNSS
jgi:hypothetical protein